MADIDPEVIAELDRQADASYEARHYPWHEPGERCSELVRHSHLAFDRIVYSPQMVWIRRP